MKHTTATPEAGHKDLGQQQSEGHWYDWLALTTLLAMIAGVITYLVAM